MRSTRKRRQSNLARSLRIERRVPVGDRANCRLSIVSSDRRASTAVSLRPARAGRSRRLGSDGSFVLRDALQRRLYSPLDSGLATPLADDPFGWLATLPRGPAARDVESGTGGRPAGRPSRRRDRACSIIATLAGLGVRIAYAARGARRGGARRSGARSRRIPTSRSTAPARCSTPSRRAARRSMKCI